MVRLSPTCTATLALLLIPVAASANDRDLRERPIAAAACAVSSDNPNNLSFQGTVLDRASYVLVGNRVSKSLEVICPLAMHDIELPSRANPSEISRLRIHYEDGDGLAGDIRLTARLVRHNVGGPQLTVTPICSWDSNTAGSGATGVTSATFDCPHDLSNRGFYKIEVAMSVSSAVTGSRRARFFGLTFP